MRTLLVLLCVVFCHWVTARVSLATPDDPRRWIPGDLHMHVSPPDDPTDVAMSAAEIARAAKKQGMEFVILTPHFWKGEALRPFQKRWKQLAAEARKIKDVTLIPGVEYAVPKLGHFGVSGVDVTTLGEDLLADARKAGAFITVNHPFALPTKIPGVRVSHFDMSYTPWSGGARGWSDFDGVEVWNVPLAIANLISKPGGRTGEERAFEEADRRARTEHRRVTVTGGTDNHRHVVVPTTWVLAADATEASILAALRAGATCVGGPEAGELRAHGDGDPADHWGRIGDSVHAAKHVELRWTGTAELFVDGADQGARDGGGGVTVDVDPDVHTFRITIGASRCGFVYANLDP
jgi:hypothetical protein